MSTDKNDHLQLPRQRQGTPVPMPKTSGEWTQHRSQLLRQLSDGIDAQEMGAVKPVISSIPDPWARSLLFQYALFGGKANSQNDDAVSCGIKALHRQMLGEWRGLMALLAFCKCRGIPLKWLKIDLEAETKRASSAQNFARVLKKMDPVSTIAKDVGWNEQYVILVEKNQEEIIVGITSPVTLVCTPADRIRGLKLNWINEGLFQDPISCLSRDEKQDMANWLWNVSNAVGRFAEPDSPMDQNLRKELRSLLDKFVSELIGTKGKNEPQLDTRAQGLSHPLYDCLGTPLKASRVIDQSDLFLKSVSRGKNNDLLILDETCYEQWKKKDANLSEHNIMVCPGMNLPSYRREGRQEGEEGEKFRIGENYLSTHWMKPEAVLLPQLLYFEVADQLDPSAVESIHFPKLSFNGEQRAFILPVAPKLLNYLTPEEISSGFHIETSGTGDLRVTLTLPLQREGVTIERLYESEKGQIKQIASRLIPAVRVWPDFIDKNWKAYFSFFCSDSEEAVLDDACVCTPWAEEGDENSFQIPKPGIQVTRLTRFPESYICYNRSQQSGQLREVLPAGLILLKKPRKTGTKQGIWHVGVDFGTTSTTISCSKGENRQPELLKFRNRVVGITNPSELPDMVNMSKHFIPRLTADGGEELRKDVKKEYTGPELPTLSWLRTRPESDYVSGGAGGFHWKFPMTEAHIVFWTPIMLYSLNWEEFRYMHFNLKWAHDQQERNNIGTFIEQLILQVSAEAVSDGVKEIVWRYSYPSAFTIRFREEMFTFWNLLVPAVSDKTLKKGLNEVTGIRHALETGFQGYSESLATALHLSQKYKAATDMGTVSVDIGGGTTDISVWKNGGIIQCASLKFAARQIFLPVLGMRAFKQVFNERMPNPQMHPIRFEDLSQDLQNGILEAIIKTNFNVFRTILATTGTELDSLMRLVTFGFCGVFSYVGMLLKALGEAGLEHKPKIYICGNGGQVLHWLCRGSYRGDSQLAGLFDAVIQEYADIKGDAKEKFEIILSEDPKLEVALGLATTGGAALNNDFEREAGAKVVAGEEYTVRTQNKDESFSSTYDRETIEAGIRLAGQPKMGQLRKLVSVFNSANRKLQLGWPEINASDKWLTVEERVNQYLSNQAALNIQDRDLEPIYIVALRELLEMLMEEERKKS